METMFQLKTLVLLALAYLAAAANAKTVNCYYGTWAGYRPGNGKFEASNIDPHLCTHISYSFFGIESSGKIKVLDSWMDLNSGLKMISRTVALKKKNHNLKVIAVVGGWDEGSAKYSEMAGNANKRKTFINSALEFIKEHKFDGLDLDWEYPTQRKGSPKDKYNFVTLLKELKEAFKSHKFELSIAVGASLDTAAKAYDIPQISKYVDFINVMTYDSQEDGKLSFNAPLKHQGTDNVEDAIKYWLHKGAPAKKLILGLAFYGHNFRYKHEPTPGSPSAGEGPAGPFTDEAGYLGYNEICTAIKSSYTTKFDDSYDVPYSYNGKQWIGYDNVKSITLKVKYANKMHLGGVMAWSIDTDDFRGECGEKYPLLNAIKRTLQH